MLITCILEVENALLTVTKINGEHANDSRTMYHFCCEIRILKPSRRELMQDGMPLFTRSSVTNQYYGT